MYPGSGPSDRDNDIFFPPIRRAFLKTGVAVASFDKRGVGGSSGSWLEAGIEDQAGDLASFLRVVRETVPEVPVGLFGHSQGGWVVIESAATSEPDFVIMSSCPGVTPRVQEEFSASMRVNRLSLGTHERQAALASLRELFEKLSVGEDWGAAHSWMTAMERVEHFAALKSVGAFVPDDPDLWAFAGRILEYDPVEALSALTMPVMAVLGSDDDIVPVIESAAIYRRTVSPRLLTLRIVNGGDHRMQDPRTTEWIAEFHPALVGFVTTVLQDLQRARR